MTELTLIYILLGVTAAAVILLLLVIMNNRGLSREVNAMVSSYQKLTQQVEEIRNENKNTVQNIQGTLNLFGETLSRSQRDSAETQDKRLFELNNRFSQMAVENEQKLENIRTTMEKKIGDLTEDNSRQLEKMRETVDEKLQKTLEDRISQSFKLVSERLEQVYKGLGEMQNLAAGVGDLKKVLSNVKTRGILGEVQLGAILEQILSPDQYETDVKTRPGSTERVEFAVKLPGDDDGGPVWLPIDAKFPGDAYARLNDAYETGDKALIDAAYKNLEKVIKSEAKDIKTKYVEPPYTTDFAIMFLPFEGLYAEVVRHGLIEVLQKEYKVNIAGPTTMAALLNSLQMGFRTLAIQKHSSEVWEVLGAVKTEFNNFGNVLEKARNRIKQADDELEKLIGTRTNAIIRKLRSVEAIDSSEAESVLELPDFNKQEN
ncbi:MAG: DNA recombination protein RmuC [Anaerovoracaceae bacterium]|nr:DNA recombination protein RmuC [Anaerovoracaceae bacterium]